MSAPGAAGRPTQPGLARTTLIYGAGMVLSRAASLIMLPIYTRLLTPADYGLLHFLDLTVEVATILVSAGMTMGLLRFYFKAQTEQARNEVVNSALVLQLGLDVVATVLIILAADPIRTYGLDGAATRGMIYLAAVNLTVGSLSVVPLLKMQADQKAGAFLLATVGKLVLQLTLNIVFLVGFRMGPMGILWSTFASGLVVGTISVWWLLRRTGLAISKAAMADLRRFGVPYQFMAGGSFILAFGDRFVLQPVAGLAVVGVYSLAYQFGMLAASLGATPFMRAWNPIRFSLIAAPVEVRDPQFDQGFWWFDIVCVTLAVGVALFIRPVIMIVADPEFWGAAGLVPVLLLAYQLQLWSEAARFGIDASEQTRYASYAVWISVVACIALYLALIPPFGAMGAAVATVGAFYVRFQLTYFWGQRLFPIRYHWAPHLKLLGIASVVVAATFAMPGATILTSLAAGFVGLAGYALLAWFLALAPGDRNEIVTVVRGGPAAVRALLQRARGGARAAAS